MPEHAKKHFCNTLRRSLRALCIARGPMTIAMPCNESLKLPRPCIFCLCIHASLSPEMNSLGTVRDSRRWRNRVPRSAADCETRVKSADGPNKKVPESFCNGLEESVENRKVKEHERRPAFRVSRTGGNPLLTIDTIWRD